MNGGQVFALVVVAITAWVLVAVVRMSRRHNSTTVQKVCKGCATGHPGFAKFCRRCGRPL